MIKEAKRTSAITEAAPEGSGTGASIRTFTDPALPYFGPTLLRVAWLGIALGLVMEGLLLLLSGGFGELPGLQPAIADLVKNVSWSVLVCAGLAVGTTLSRAGVPAMGLLGFLSALWPSTTQDAPQPRRS